MSILAAALTEEDTWPDHMQLPFKDDIPVNCATEHSQSALLTSAIEAHLEQLHGGDEFFIGTDVGIYFRYTDPPLDGCRSPDWYYVAGVPRLLKGEYRRSYVMWKEKVRPTIVLEYLSIDKGEEHDQTPEKGKFWIYEQVIQVPYYGIFSGKRRVLEFYQLVDGVYESQEPDEHGQYAVPEMKLRLGLWHGRYNGYEKWWMRWFDETGVMIPTAEEIAARENTLRQKAALATRKAKRAEQEAKDRVAALEAEKAEMAEKLRALGIDPDRLA